MIPKELFVETLGELKKQFKHDEKCSKAFEVILPHDYVSYYDNTILVKQIIKVLETLMEDQHEVIKHFIYDLEFGKLYKKCMVTEIDGKAVSLPNAEKLWELLVQKINKKESSSLDPNQQPTV